MERLLDQRSRADWSASYLMWLITDFHHLYAAEKTGQILPDSLAWAMAIHLFSWPELPRPPDMYTWYLHYGLDNRPSWIEPGSDDQGIV